MRARLATVTLAEWAALGAFVTIVAVMLNLPALLPALLTGILTDGGLL